MEFGVLGRLEVLDGGRDISPARPKRRALLALLLLRAGELVSLDEAVDALWEGRPPPAARNAVQGHIAALRKLLGPSRIETRGDAYVFELVEGELDLHRFERYLTDGRGREPQERAEILAAGLRLFRGEPLEDFRYQAFAAAEAARIGELRLEALEERIDADLALGRHAQVVPELERLVADEPLRERLRGQLMLAFYRSGRQAEALDVYRRARAALVEGLGIDPDPSLQRLERRILNQDPELDLAAARPHAFRRRRRRCSGANASSPRPATSFYAPTFASDADRHGRRGQDAPGARGRSRRDSPVRARDTHFVPLAPLADPELVLPTIARAVGSRRTGRRRSGGPRRTSRHW